MPVTVVLADLEEGIRFVADLAAADADGVEVGDAVEVTYASYADDVRLPQFRRVGAR
jgi:uncharacterized OB-fold protein